jgi:RNA 3'-terminal phosphate cyclase (ATP)
LPAIGLIGYSAQVDYSRAGFYPRGGGDLKSWIGSCEPQYPLLMPERGELKSLKAFVVTSGLPSHVAERGRATIEKFMKGVGRKIEVILRDKESPGQGAAVVITATCDGGFAGFTSIGERGKPMERVAEEPCQQFMKWWTTGAACDERLADQLVLPASLVKGESRWSTPRLTEHMRTVLFVVKQFVPIEYSLESGPGENTTVILNGAGIEYTGTNDA